MSTPVALRLDSPIWVRNRAIVPVVVAILVIGSVGGWLLLSSGSNSVSLPKVAVASPSASSLVSAPHSEDGTVAAAASFVSLYGELLGSPDPTSADVLAGVVDSSAAPDLITQIRGTLNSVQSSVPAGTSLNAQLTPVAYKVLTYARNGDSTVGVWSVLVLGNGSSSKSYWTTSEVSLRWSSKHFFVTKWVVRPGPSPQNSSVSPGITPDNAASLLQVDGYKAFRTAAADASMSAVSIQGSK